MMTAPFSVAIGVTETKPATEIFPSQIPDSRDKFLNNILTQIIWNINL
jgi:hypothetical protein